MNGIPVVEMGYMVKPGDVVNFDGNVLTPEKKEYILLNKPKNFTTALDEGQEYRNVLELVKGSTTSKIGAVGRMDKNTTGLLLFTNDTDMIRKFTLPTNKSSKIYQVSLDKNLKFEDLEKINKSLYKDLLVNNKRCVSDEIEKSDNKDRDGFIMNLIGVSFLVLITGLDVFLALFSLSSYSNKPNQHSSVSEDHSVTDSLNKNTSKSEAVDITKVAFEHILDSHSWHFWGEGHDALVFSLPIIIYSNTKGLQTFMSSRFDHGHASYNNYSLIDEKIVSEIKSLPQVARVNSICFE